MKRLGYLALIALVLFNSCDKRGMNPDDVQNIDLDWPGFIWFGADIPTKTETITNMRGRTFDVVAFKYGSDWNTFKATGTPASSGGTKGFSCPTDVSCDANGICTYQNNTDRNPVEWDGTMKYSFFAFYPVTGTQGVTLSSTASTPGVPKITYTVPSSNDADALPDVMTASNIDVQNTGSGTVSLNFKHQLSLLTVEARNLDKSDITISNLVLTITSKRYGSIIIPLDGSAATPGNTVTNNFSFAMQGGESVTVEEFGKYGTSENTVVSSKNITLIPQDPLIIGEELEGSLTFTYGHSGTSETKGETFSSNKKFEAGKKYAFVLNFANDAVTIAIIESGEWVEDRQSIIFE